MGTQAGSIHIWGEQGVKKRREICGRLAGWTLVAAVACLSGCVISPTPKKKAGSGEWQRTMGATPQLVGTCFYGPKGVSEALLLEMEDVVRPVRRVMRIGNGALSMGLTDERGRKLKAVECGGYLVVQAEAGQSYQLVVENESDVPWEVLPSVDGLDLESGEPADLTRRGRVVPPRGKTVFTSMRGEDGKAVPLRFRQVADTSARYRTNSTGTLGSVVVAGFLGAGTESFDTRPLLTRRRTGGFPERRYEPMLLPYQYR
jgi:hypothetical protein